MPKVEYKTLFSMCNFIFLFSIIRTSTTEVKTHPATNFKKVNFQTYPFITDLSS